MDKIKHIISKPSQALQAMVDGLIEQNERPDFEINMNTFGTTSNGMCYGCAATCAIQHLTGEDFTAKNIEDDYERSQLLQIDGDDLEHFECAIDEARCGYLNGLFSYFGVPASYLNDPKFEHQIGTALEDSNWEERLPFFRERIKQLESEGL